VIILIERKKVDVCVMKNVVIALFKFYKPFAAKTWNVVCRSQYMYAILYEVADVDRQQPKKI
jgi:hypothetical protein